MKSILVSRIKRLLLNKLNKKAQSALNFLKSAVLAIGIVAIFGSAIALALDRINTAGAFTNDSATFNIVSNGTEGVLIIMSLLAGAIVSAILLKARVIAPPKNPTRAKERTAVLRKSNFKPPFLYNLVKLFKTLLFFLIVVFCILIILHFD